MKIMELGTLFILDYQNYLEKKFDILEENLHLQQPLEHINYINYIR